MRSVNVKTNVPAPKGLGELKQHNRVDLKVVRNGASFGGKRMHIENGSKINEDVDNIRPMELGQPESALNKQHQQPQGSAVQWDSFLPVRSLKVLLVENDDSTRHVVSALLRNCSYEVTAVANGLEAWKLLIDLNKQIDLVLTEVAMPCLSGIGLLSKITNHVTRKNIPVIMMSSDDSMGIVFNCLSRGAVDFLVKPIRKNELKNLWQHVWRKCHSQSSGSGSGSESGIRDHISTKSRSIEESDDDGENNDEASIELNAKGGSDNGSGTQSSWPKRVVEVDSSQENILWDKVSNPHDITSTQVARPETSKLEMIEMGKDLKIGVSKSSSFGLEEANKKMDKFCESNMKKVDDKLDTDMHLGSENSAPRTEPLGATKTNNAHKEALKSSHLLKSINIDDKSVYRSKESPALELSLKRTREFDGADITQERNILRHSNISDFSRYNTVSHVNQDPTANVDSCSPRDITSEAAKQNNIQSNSTPNNRSNGSDDMGSTTNNAFTTKPDDKQPPNTSTAVVVKSHHTTTMQPLAPSATEGNAVKTTAGQSKTVEQQVQVRHHHHHYHHHHHHVHKLDEQKTVEADDGSLRNMVSNILTGSGGNNAANFGSASGSNNKSNGENGGSWPKGSSSALVVEGGKVESDNAVAKKYNGGDGSGSGSGVDQERLARREAALNKFRLKRKERCFGKRVRYESKKKLAEQRPRVRGQFVRHGVNNEDADS